GVYIASYSAQTVNLSAWPIQNATVRASMGNSNQVPLGVVTFATTYYFLGQYPCELHGARHNMPSIKGDSGSPIWLTSPSRAIGVHSATAGYFAKVQLALDQWGGSVF